MVIFLVQKDMIEFVTTYMRNAQGVVIHDNLI